MKKNAVETDRRRVKKLVEGKNFDFLIMSLICMDAVILGLMTSDAMKRFRARAGILIPRRFLDAGFRISADAKQINKKGRNAIVSTFIACG